MWRLMRRGTALLGFVLCVVFACVGPAAAQSDDGTKADQDRADQDHNTAGDSDGTAQTTLEGTIRLGFDRYIAGVEITVTDQAGAEIGRTATGAEGRWLIAVPDAGTYLVTLDEETLPDDLGLREGQETTVETTVFAGMARAVVFAVGETPKTTPFGERFAQRAFTGLKLGMIIAMSAVGLSLIYGTTGLVNFAHGELVTFGAVIAWYFNTSWGGLNLVVAAALGLIVCGALGAGLESGLFRPLQRRRLGVFQLVVITIGLSLLGRQAIQLFFGAEPRPYVDYQVQDRWDFGPWAVTPREVATVATIAVVLAVVAITLQLSRFGKATRAVADNTDLARVAGIDVNRVVLIVWTIGAMLAGLGGIFVGLDADIDPYLGFQLLLLIFAGVELGGLGTAYGAVVGSVLIGFATEISTLWISPELKFVVPLAVLILVLLLRPQGLFGIRERVG
ncbi:MAG: branched-chain amino acid ABC transporter permease [Acidimicrobiaceae bacterium]|nr:branched-chain amino acid ABC transporter permease [Acidimicrobiaceae bacterium]MXW76560.1 branched-chain amino acid ABC transporter permease [Acidimicrobiaceae bacterium]MYC42848.1 branched-chain amino acid ABC transporter permease [Acidimicrobiaceae bacterium]MYD08349.1 branched-chain amino acid ABC transporter permease [Acidimicrobiaceae bacterium]MYI57096.1 branched-chain amino acid ABC transporter permease [Acidimicrobiaceae bacterium]